MATNHSKGARKEFGRRRRSCQLLCVAGARARRERRAFDCRPPPPPLDRRRRRRLSCESNARPSRGPPAAAAARDAMSNQHRLGLLSSAKRESVARRKLAAAAAAGAASQSKIASRRRKLRGFAGAEWLARAPLRQRNSSRRLTEAAWGGFAWRVGRRQARRGGAQSQTGRPPLKTRNDHQATPEELGAAPPADR